MNSFTWCYIRWMSLTYMLAIRGSGCKTCSRHRCNCGSNQESRLESTWNKRSWMSRESYVGWMRWGTMKEKERQTSDLRQDQMRLVKTGIDQKCFHRMCQSSHQSDTARFCFSRKDFLGADGRTDQVCVHSNVAC